MDITLSTTVGTRSVRCRNNSLNLRTLSQAPRHFEKQPITQSSVTIAYIHYSSQRASPPPRCTCAHVSQDSSPTTSAWSFLLHAGPSIYRAPGYPDLSAVLPPCVASLAEHEESVEAFSLFFLIFFFLHRRHSCSRPAVSRPMAWLEMPSHLHRHRHLLHRHALLYKLCSSLASVLFTPKISPPGPGLLIHDSTRRVPCLFNVSPVRRRHTEFFHRNLSPRLLSCPPRVA